MQAMEQVVPQQGDHTEQDDDEVSRFFIMNFQIRREHFGNYK